MIVCSNKGISCGETKLGQLILTFAKSTVISVIMPPLDVKGGIITVKFSQYFLRVFFLTCFGLVMYIWELMGVTEKFAFQM